MASIDMNDFLKDFAVPIVSAFLGAGGFGAYFIYKGNKPKNSAEAQKLSADVIVTFADGWQKYAEKLETRMDEMEKNFDLKEKTYTQALLSKDEKIKELEGRINVLEAELELREGIKQKAEEAREILHHSVDDSINEIKK